MAFRLDSIVHVKPHFGIRPVDAANVVLLSERKTVLLTGLPYVRLVPRLDGSAPLWQVMNELKAEVPVERLFHALNRMEREGLLAEGAPDADPVQRYWNLIGSSADAAASRLEQARIAVNVLGLDEGFGTELAAAFEHAGVRCVDDDQANLHVVLTDDYLNPGLAALNRRFAEQGRSWVIAKPVGDILWFGPAFGAEGPCWECLASRLQENMYGQFALSFDENHGAPAPVSVLPAARQAALNFLCAGIVRWLGKGEAPAFERQLVSMRVENLETDRHHVFSDPSCTCCTETGRQRRTHNALLELHNSLATDRQDAGYRVCGAAETLKRLQPLVSPLTGIVPCLEKAPSMETSHVYYARHTFRAPVGLTENRWIGKPSWACGKGATDVQARVSCVAEAVERYSSGFFGSEDCREAPMAEVERAVAPTALLNFSDAQYDARERWNRDNRGFNWIPERFDAARPISWSPVQSLVDGGQHWMPTALCYLNFPLPDDHQFGRADANGCAAGNTIEEAILQGLFELVERDAVALWWYNRIRRPAVDLDSFGVEYFGGVRRELAAKGRALEVLDITSDLGIYTFAAASWRERGDRIYVGFGSHLDPRIAISRALNEVSQLTAYHDQENAPADPHFARWLDTATLDGEDYVRPLAGELRDAARYPVRLSGNLAEDIKFCVDDLAGRDLDVLVCDMTRSNVGFPVVRVVVPGLRHFWMRLAPGRLYDVPVNMGWLDQPRREDEMNPVPFPL